MKTCDYTITNKMGDQHAVDGHYWGRSDQGDWGLWLCEDDES